MEQRQQIAFIGKVLSISALLFAVMGPAAGGQDWDDLDWSIQRTLYEIPGSTQPGWTDICDLTQSNDWWNNCHSYQYFADVIPYSPFGGPVGSQATVVYKQGNQFKFRQSLLNEVGTQRKTRECPYDETTGIIDWGACGAWSGVPQLSTLIPGRGSNQRYVAYSTHRFDDGTKLRETLLAPATVDIFGNTLQKTFSRWCPITQSGIQWSSCSGWTSFNLASALAAAGVQMPVDSFGALCDYHWLEGPSQTEKINVSLITDDGQHALRRTCTVSALQAAGVSTTDLWAECLKSSADNSFHVWDPRPGQGQDMTSYDCTMLLEDP